MTAPKVIIVFGPQGCGKTRNAARIASALGAGSVVDDWPQCRDPLTSRAFPILLLTNESSSTVKTLSKYPNPYVRLMHFEEAMRLVALFEAHDDWVPA